MGETEVDGREAREDGYAGGMKLPGPLRAAPSKSDIEVG